MTPSNKISKRAGAFSRLFGGGTRVAEELSEAASKIDKVLPGVEALPGLSKVPLKVLSEAGSIETKALFRNIQTISKNEEAARILLTVGNDVGYGASSVDDLLSVFSKEFSEMIEAMNSLPDAPSPAQLDEFYAANKKAIDFFKELKKNSEIRSAITTGMREVSEAGKVVIPADIAGAVNNASKGGSKAGIVLALGKSLLPLAPILAVGGVIWWFSGKIEEKGLAGAIADLAGVTQSPESEDFISSAEKAVECLDSIKVLNGTDASKAKALVRENFLKFIALKSAPTLNGEEEIKSALSSADSAAVTLVADAQTSGSIQNFMALVIEHPEQLSGFSEWQIAGGAAVLAGGLAAAGVVTAGGAWWAALLGVAIAGGGAGSIGLYWMSHYYDDQLDCLRGGMDSIVSFKTKFDKLRDGERAGTQGADGLKTTSPKDITTQSLLVKIISVMQSKKLAGIPGLEFVNEMNMAQAVVGGAGGIENAATILSGANANISAYISVIRNDDSVVIDSEFVKSNEPLIDTIYLTMHSIFKNALRGKRTLGIFNPKMDDLIKYVREYLSSIGYKITSAKNNENKMKKESKSTNSLELVRKAAETKVSYFMDANLGLKDQLTKAYYAGLSGMYNEQTPKKASDYKDFYGFQNESKEDIVLQSHPKSITLADSMGKGGLVENGLEQKEQTHYVATKTPSGNFQSKYAATINYLEKLSKSAEQQGKKEVTELIKQTIKNLK